MGWRRARLTVVSVIAIEACGPSVADTGGGGGGADGSGGTAGDVDGASASDLDGGSADGTSASSGAENCPLPAQGGRLSATIVDEERAIFGLAIDAASGDRFLAGEPCVQRVDATGAPVWTHESDGGTCTGVASTSSVVSVGRSSGSAGSVLRLDAESGAVIGEVPLPVAAQPQLTAAADGTLYAVVRDGPFSGGTATMTAIDPDGQLAWTTELPGPLGSKDLAVAVGRDGPLVGLFLEATEHGGTLHAFDESGALLWTWTLAEPGDRILSIAADATGIWVVAGNPTTEYSNSGGVGAPGWIVRLDADGEQRFAKSTLDDPAIEYPRVVATDPCVGVYLAGHGSTLGDGWGRLWVARIDDDANVLWSDEWDGSVVELPDSPTQRDGHDVGTAIAIDPAGTIVVGGSTEVREVFEGDVVSILSQDWLGEYAP